jgi:hypothetical protein
MHMKNNKKHTINQLQEGQKQGEPSLFNNVSSAVKKQGKQTGLCLSFIIIICTIHGAV